MDMLHRLTKPYRNSKETLKPLSVRGIMYNKSLYPPNYSSLSHVQTYTGGSVLCRWNPHGMNYCTPYPVAEGVRDYLSHDVVCTVHIGIDAPSVTGTKQAAFHPPACILRLFTHWLQI